jgi:hypothetical protein
MLSAGKDDFLPKIGRVARIPSTLQTRIVPAALTSQATALLRGAQCPQDYSLLSHIHLLCANKHSLCVATVPRVGVSNFFKDAFFKN